MSSCSKILIMGLPGAGKTTLARIVAARYPAVHFNADEVRENVNKDLRFSVADRIEQATRMGWLCDQVVRGRSHVVADFVCPTEETRAAFGPAFVVWVDRIAVSRFADTNRLFSPPDRYDVCVGPEGSPEYWAEKVVAAASAKLRSPPFDVTPAIQSAFASGEVFAHA